jgi:hypothetical protein
VRLDRLPTGALAGDQPIRQSSRASGDGKEQAQLRNPLEQNGLTDNSDRRAAATEKRERSYPEPPAQPYRQGAAGLPLTTIVNAKTLGTTVKNGNALMPIGLVEPSPDRSPARITSVP